MSPDRPPPAKPLARRLRAGLRRAAAGWPHRCALCGEWGGAALCRACVARFAAAVPRCPRCALPGSATQPCGACLRQPPPQDAAITLAGYAFPWDGLIARLKFGAEPELARPLGGLLARRAAGTPRDSPLPALLLPVPLSAARLAERGYNQAALLAQAAAAALGIACVDDVLQRWRDTPHQVGAPRDQRTANLAASMWIDPPRRAAVEARRVALVDDVMTTGATVHAAVRTLRAAGAAAVEVWVLARTDAPGADD